MKKIKLGLLGFGTVGSGVVRVLKENKEEINEKVGAELELKAVLVRDKSKRREFMEGLTLTENIEDILGDEEIDVVIELIGGINPAKDYMLRALNSGKSVVTANKDVVAQFGSELLQAAQKNNVGFKFEASVGGGIPIITPLRECLTANKISEIMGIVNGTTNYMLTKMSRFGSDYDEILAEAQKMGYAEANPAADVEGLDAARKAAILASLAFNAEVTFDDVSVEGITKITANDIAYAKEFGHVIKLLAVAKETAEHGIDVRVHPVLLPENHPLASVNDVFNAIFVRGNAIGEAMFYGRGAGSLPTASAVMADVIDISRDIVNDTFGRIAFKGYPRKKMCPLADTESAYYVRMIVEDRPGVLGAIAMAFGNNGVSLNSVIQTRKYSKQTELVAITHSVYHRAMENAQRDLEKLPSVNKICNIIRVELDREAQ